MFLKKMVNFTHQFFRGHIVRINVKMLQYKQIGASEGIDINNTSASTECILLMNGFKFESHICKNCHIVLITAYELKNIAILNVKDADFRCILWGISKIGVNRLNNSVLENKGLL